MPIVVVLAVVLVGVLVLTRANEIFCLSVRNGRLLLVRGRVPNPLFHDLEDVVRRAGVAKATIRAVKSDGHARIVVSGADGSVAQRCRNAFGAHPIHKLSAPRDRERSRNLGQLIGFAWLAWLLAPRH